jgi:hypothetical protein
MRVEEVIGFDSRNKVKECTPTYEFPEVVVWIAADAAEPLGEPPTGSPNSAARRCVICLSSPTVEPDSISPASRLLGAGAFETGSRI